MFKKLMSGVMSVLMIIGPCCATGVQASERAVETKKSTSRFGWSKKKILGGAVMASAVAGAAYYLFNKDQNAANFEENIVMDYANSDKNFGVDVLRNMKNCKESLTIQNFDLSAVELILKETENNLSTKDKKISNKVKTYFEKLKNSKNGSKGTLVLKKEYNESEKSAEINVTFIANEQKKEDAEKLISEDKKSNKNSFKIKLCKGLTMTTGILFLSFYAIQLVRGITPANFNCLLAASNVTSAIIPYGLEQCLAAF